MQQLRGARRFRQHGRKQAGGAGLGRHDPEIAGLGTSKNLPRGFDQIGT
jgi:hypothetical protein